MTALDHGSRATLASTKISFTGSSATGKLVTQSASKTLKRVTLELLAIPLLSFSQ